METVQAVYFCFGRKPANSKFATKTAKKNVDIVILHRETIRKIKLKRLWFYCDFKDGWRRRTFSERVQYYPEHPETFDSETETGITESQEAIDDFINQQKSANKNKKKATDMNTLLRYIEANGMKNEKIEAYLRPSLTTFCRNLFERTEEKRRRIWASDSFQFSTQYKLPAILRRKIHLTYPRTVDRTMSSKNPEKSLQRSESHLFWHEHCNGNKPPAAQAIDEDQEDVLVLILNSATPIHLRFKELCGGFYTTLRSPSKRISVKRSVTVFHRSSLIHIL